MNRPKKKGKSKKKTSPPPEPPSYPSFSLLPDEISVNFLARISRAYYPRLSIISKSFRSLLSSKELYLSRSQIGSTEQCLYVCLSDDSYQFPQWFTLWINPNRTLTVSTIIKKKKKKKTVGKWLAPIPSSDFPSVSQSTLVSGSDIYVIGGPIKTKPLSKGLSRYHPSSTVRVLDCGTHTWRDAPENMIVARKHPLTCFYDGKIYVMGGCGDEDEPWGEVFDIKMQTWGPLSDPGAEIRRCGLDIIEEMKGKIYVWNANRTYAYDTSQDSWESVGNFHESKWLMDGWVAYRRIRKSECVLGGVWYCIGYGCHFCSWTKDRVHWKVVKGLDSLLEMYIRNGGSIRNNTKFVSCGGKLLLLWDGYRKHNPSNRKKIWCAEITMETDDDEGEVWGNVESIDVVQSVPIQCELLHSLVVSV